LADTQIAPADRSTIKRIGDETAQASIECAGETTGQQLHMHTLTTVIQDEGLLFGAKKQWRMRRSN
jgi:hypothetical protein